MAGEAESPGWGIKRSGEAKKDAGRRETVEAREEGKTEFADAIVGGNARINEGLGFSEGNLAAKEFLVDKLLGREKALISGLLDGGEFGGDQGI